MVSMPEVRFKFHLALVVELIIVVEKSIVLRLSIEEMKTKRL